MDDLGKLGTFTINANLELLGSVQDLNDCMDELVHELFHNSEVSSEIWETLMIMRTSLDKMTKHCIILPSIVHKLVPNTHVPRHTENKVRMKALENETVPVG